jgi:hypothetical protein
MPAIKALLIFPGKGSPHYTYPEIKLNPVMAVRTVQKGLNTARGDTKSVFRTLSKRLH